MFFSEVIIDVDLDDKHIAEIREMQLERIFFTSEKYFKKYKSCFNTTSDLIDLNSHQEERLRKEIDEYWDSLSVKKFGDKTISQFLPDINLKYSYWFAIRFPVYFHFKDSYRKYCLFKIISGRVTNRALCYSSFNLGDVLPNISFKKVGKASSKIKSSILLQYLFVICFRIITGLVTSLRCIIIKPNNWLTNTTNHLQKVYDYATDKLIEGNNYQYYLLKKCLSEKDFGVVSEYSMPSLANEEKRKFNWRMIFPKGWEKSVNLEIFFIPALLIIIYAKPQKKYKKRYLNLLCNQLDSKSGIDYIFLNSVQKKWNLVSLSIFRDYVSNMFLSLFKPKTIASVCEYNLNNYSLLKQFSFRQGNTLAIQHGAVFKENISYFYSSKEDFQNVYLPDKTIVWGNRWKNNLIKECNYPENGVEVLGQIRSESIHYLKRKKRSETKFFLYISQPLRSGEEWKREELLQSFLNVCYQNPDKEFKIKPHPRETDLEYFYSRIREKKLRNVTVDYSDLFLLLASSKAVIIYFSTVGIEALAFNKQLIVLDFFNEDSLGLIKDDVGIRVKNVTEFNKVVREIDSGIKSISLESINNYVNSYFYKIESGISQRYINYIKSFNDEK